ncbi:coiled-coil domain-containing protein 38 isoform X2 [Hyperolius riggenbachi]|uniref:coiled-coil domain-containing protein 38 isoform X2 n=1 Tax=Hyperolius riggenbachi TaxID=752182 RepID=UPI0035A3B945
MSNYTLQESGTSTKHKSDIKKTCQNPFMCPTDDILTYKELKKQEEEEEEKECGRKLKVWQRTTAAYTARKCDLDNDSKEKYTESEVYYANKLPSIPKGYSTDRTCVTDYIAEKRKISLQQYSGRVKQDVINQMSETLSREARKIVDAKRTLEEDTMSFQEFLKESEKNAAEATKMADQEMKVRQGKETEVKKVCAQIKALKRDLLKEENTLQEYKVYADVLHMVSPPEWKEVQEQRRSREAAKRREDRRQIPPLPEISKKEGRRLSNALQRLQVMSPPRSFYRYGSSASGSRSPARSLTEHSGSETEDLDNEEEPELYFTDPQQLIQILKELEDDNFHLLENLQEEEESLHELRQRSEMFKQKKEKELKSVIQNKENLSIVLAKETEITEKREMKIKLFSFGELNASEQDKMLSKLTKLIANVYISCIGEIQATIDPIHMLASIENSITEVEENLDSAPREYVEAVRKEKNKEMRKRLHEEKRKDQERNQAVRVNRTIQRAITDRPKLGGRKLMKRSEPPSTRKKIASAKKEVLAKKEERSYFLT